MEAVYDPNYLTNISDKNTDTCKVKQKQEDVILRLKRISKIADDISEQLSEYAKRIKKK